MALLDLTPYAEMTAAERTQRIGVLLETALVRYHRRQRELGALRNCEKRENAAATDPAFLVSDETDKEMVRRVARLEEATPHDLALALGLSRATVGRKLARLKTAGVFLVSGKTSATRYRLRGDSTLN
ncbi:MAG: hypothetical protein PHQ04_04130 [Opitutaceae bacterium]|nr:hypothetical protein [Opitutaceae bacterium]